MYTQIPQQCFTRLKKKRKEKQTQDKMNRLKSVTTHMRTTVFPRQQKPEAARTISKLVFYRADDGILHPPNLPTLRYQTTHWDRPKTAQSSRCNEGNNKSNSRNTAAAKETLCRILEHRSFHASSLEQPFVN